MATNFATNQPIMKWPADLRPNQITFHLRASTAAFYSPFTRSSQTQELPGQLFELSAAFPELGQDKAAQARALLARLRGQAGRFYFPANCYGRNLPSAYAAESLTVIPLTADRVTITADTVTVTADATTTSYESLFTADGGGSNPLKLSGTLWINSGIRPLKVGGYISFDDPTTPTVTGPHRHLHMVVGIEQDGLKTVLELEPPLLVQPLSMTPIHVHAPSGVFRLVDDGQGAMAQRPGHRFELSLSAIQARPLAVTV